MHRADIAAFAATASCQIHEAFGQPIVWQGRTYCAALTGLTTRREIQGAGFEILPDCIARVSLVAHPDFDPLLGQTITLEGRAYKVAEKTILALSQEIRLGLKKA